MKTVCNLASLQLRKKCSILYHIILLIVICNSCSKPPREILNPPGVNPHTPTISNMQLKDDVSVLILNHEGRTSLTALSGDSILKVNDLNNVVYLKDSVNTTLIPASAINVGDFLFSDSSEALPAGIMARVVNVSKDGGGFIVTTTRTTLDAIFKSLKLDWNYKFDESDTSELADDFSKSIIVGAVGEELKIGGAYKLNFINDLKIVIENGSLKIANLDTRIKTELIASNSLVMERPFKKDTSIILKTIDLFSTDKINLGRVKFPLRVHAQLHILLKASVNGQLQVSNIYKLQNESSLSFGYIDGQLKLPTGKIIDNVNDTSFQESKLSGEMSVGIASRLAVSFYQKKPGLGSLFTDLGLYGKINGTCSDTGLIVKSSAEIKAEIGGEINLFGFNPSKSTELFKAEETLYKKVFFEEDSICNLDKKPPVTQAGAVGDVHIQSFSYNKEGRIFSGLTYDVQGVSEYTLFKSNVTGLTIQGRTGLAYSQSTNVSWLKSIALTSTGEKVLEIKCNPLTVYVDKVRVDPSSEIKLNKATLKRSGNNFQIEFRTGDRIEINTYSQHLNLFLFLTARHRNRTANAMLGVFSDETPVVKTKEGQTVNPNKHEEMYHAYTESYRIKAAESLFTYENGTSHEQYTNLAYPTQAFIPEPQQLNNAYEKCLAAGLSDPRALNWCAYDYMAAGDENAINSALDVQDKLDVTTNEICRLDFDGNLLDQSQQSNHATASGSISYTKDRNQKENSALLMNGSNSVYIQNTAALMSGLARTFTIALFVRVDEWYNGFAPIFAKSKQTDENFLQLYLTSSGRIGGNRVFFNTPPDFALGKWFHIAYTYNNGEIAYYMNGKLIGTGKNLVKVQQENLDLSVDIHGSLEHLYGSIDNLRIFSKTMNQSEILELANAL